jgi:hypothetical protein
VWERQSGSKSACKWQRQKAQLANVGAAAGGEVLSVQIRCVHSGRCMARRNVCVLRLRHAQAVSTMGGHGLLAGALVFTANIPLAARARTQGLPAASCQPHESVKIHDQCRTSGAAQQRASHYRRLHQICCLSPAPTACRDTDHDSTSSNTPKPLCLRSAQGDSHTPPQTRMQKSCQRFEPPAYAAVSWPARNAMLKRRRLGIIHHTSSCM